MQFRRHILKLKFTTKLFILCSVLSAVLRTVQIVFLTEADIKYLKPGHTFLNVLIVLLPLLIVVYTVANAAIATRRPKKMGSKGPVQFAAYTVSAVLYVVSGVVGSAGGDVSKAGLILSLAAAVYFVLLAVSSVSKQSIPKAATLLPIIYWTYELVISYLHYTKHSMRAGTVYAVLASVSSVLFFTCVGKILCSVTPSKNYRIMYPLGILTAVLCITAVVPDILAKIFGCGSMVSESFVPQGMIAANGIFSASLTLSTFKRSNTRRVNSGANREE